MSRKFHKPIRMCISCRKRDEQKNFIRLKCIDANLILFDGFGRSFYICKECSLDEKKALKALMRQCKSGEKEKFRSILKEIIADE